LKLAIWFIAGLIFVGVATLPGCAHAQVGAFKSTRLQVFQLYYSGEKEKSFAESGSALGVEAYSDWGRSWGRVYAKARASQSSGRQAFLDSTTAINCNYSYYQGQFEPGLIIFPVPSRDTGFALYISVGGDLGYNLLSLTSTSTLTSLKPSESALSFGYTMGMGVEWTLSKVAGKRNALTGEITYRSENTSLAGQSSFDLSGLAIHAGYGW